MFFKIGEHWEYNGGIYEVIGKNEWEQPRLRSQQSERGITAEFYVMPGELKLPADKSLWSDSQRWFFNKKIAEMTNMLLKYLQFLQKLKIELADVHSAAVDEVFVQGSYLTPSEKQLLKEFLKYQE